MTALMNQRPHLARLVTLVRSPHAEVEFDMDIAVRSVTQPLRSHASHASHAERGVDRRGRLILHVGQHVAVEVEGDADRGVA